MSLRGSPLLYIFLESDDLSVQRDLFETALGLDLIEVEPHLPHHRHGVVKYDAGRLILSLNQASPGAFSDAVSDGLIMVFDIPAKLPQLHALTNDSRMVDHGNGLWTDMHGHHYLFRVQTRELAEGSPRPTCEEVRLMVPNLQEAVSFYRDVLGLLMTTRGSGMARFSTGSAVLELQETHAAPDGKPCTTDPYLVVFYTANIEESYAELQRRGVAFKGSKVACSEIGWSARFEDTAGHRICLYQPSEECLAWGSGPTVLEIARCDRLAIK